MKSKDIQIGGVYLAKVSGKVVPVKVLRSSESCGWKDRGVFRTHWICRNLKTGREIEIKSAQRFRRPYNPVRLGIRQDFA